MRETAVYRANDALRRVPSWWPFALASIPLVAAIAALLAGAGSSVGYFPFITHPLILSLVGLSYVWHRRPYPRTESSDVEASASGLRFGEQEIPRSSIRSAFIVPQPRGHAIVRIHRKRISLPLEFVVRNEAEGRRFLTALGFDATQVVADFRLPSRALSRRAFLFFPLLLVPFVAFLSSVPAPAIPFAAFPLTILALASMAMIPTKLTVGADGVLTSWLGSKRFIPYGDIERVEPFEDSRLFHHTWRGIRLRLRGGEIVEIPVIQRRSWQEDRTEVIHARIREALESHHRGDAAAEASLLQRGSRSTSAWIRALGAIGTGANATHREAPIAAERLWRILEDPASAPTARAGAAVAIARGADAPETRVRLKEVANATAEPKVRIALEKVATEAPEEELETALAELEDEPAVARRATG